MKNDLIKRISANSPLDFKKTSIIDFLKPKNILPDIIVISLALITANTFDYFITSYELEKNLDYFERKVNFFEENSSFKYIMPGQYFATKNR